MTQVSGPSARPLDAATAAIQASVTRDLEVMGAADNYYEWMIEEIKPYLGPRVLECGSGTGTLTRRLLDLGLDKVIASDFDEAHLEGLRRMCAAHRGAEAILLDLEDPQAALPAIARAGVDSVVMINVLEHISQDDRCLRALAGALPAGARIIVFCPAFQALFSPLDREYGHYRRYTKASMAELGRRCGLPIAVMHYVNMPGFFAWLVLYRVLRRRGLDGGSVSVFNKLAPLVRRFESRFRPVVGLSILTVFEKV